MFIGIVSLFLTVLVYLGAKKVYQRFPRVYTSPLLVTPAVLVGLLLLVNVPYESYNLGGGLLTDMLQPATVAFAIPLYKYFPVLKKYAVEIILNVAVGSCIAIISTALIAKWLHLGTGLIDSLVPRSVTTPIAMNVSEMIGGMPAVTAVFVILTALLGTVIGPRSSVISALITKLRGACCLAQARTERERQRHLSSALCPARFPACR